jgi:cell division protein FtsN
VVFGAALILLASYAPGVFKETVVAVRQQVTEPAEAIEFNFPDMLANDSVTVDPSAYDGQFTDEDPDAPVTEFMIQVASLKSYGAASNLAAELDSSGLSARFERVVLDQVTWYRVMVGPFPGRQEANRAMTALRKRNMGPRLIKSG